MKSCEKNDNKLKPLVEILEYVPEDGRMEIKNPQSLHPGDPAVTTKPQPFLSGFT